MRLTVRDCCAECRAKIDDLHLYFRKPLTWNGLRTQARGLHCFLRALRLSLAGVSPHARSHGRIASIRLAVRVWIDHWYVLKAEGWRR